MGRRWYCIALDPGYTRTAMVTVTGPQHISAVTLPNWRIKRILREWRGRRPPLVIEQVKSYGMAVGETVFETVYWSGRFHEAWEAKGGVVHRVPRADVKLFLCGQSRAKDGNVRQALLDRFGPSREEAVGKKHSRGPLYGIKGDQWAALGVAVTWVLGD